MLPDSAGFFAPFVKLYSSFLCRFAKFKTNGKLTICEIGGKTRVTSKAQRPPNVFIHAQLWFGSIGRRLGEGCAIRFGRAYFSGRPKYLRKGFSFKSDRETGNESVSSGISGFLTASGERRFCYEQQRNHDAVF